MDYMSSDGVCGRVAVNTCGKLCADRFTTVWKKSADASLVNRTMGLRKVQTPANLRHRRRIFKNSQDVPAVGLSHKANDT